MPLWLMNALKPITPRWWRLSGSPRFSGTRPPQRPKSTSAFADATANLASNAAAVVVGGWALSGISRTAVTPPAAAPRVPASQPSQSARPGSLKCTWASTTPGRTTSPVASMTSSSSRTSVPIAEITPSLTAMSTARWPVGKTTVPPRITNEPPATWSSALFLYSYFLRPFPQREPADLGQLFLPLCNRSKVIASQLAYFAREHCGTVRKEQLGLADAARVEQ